ncbi:MAG: 6-phosphofructokinase, partial [Rickettsiales bacterium]|nr:6-phosphofructokinase [Rickettsiales bacterium]
FIKKQKCIVAISEGIKFSNGQLVGEKISKLNEKDAHGNVQLSGSSMLGDYLSNQIKIKLGIKRVRADTLGYAQRSFLGCVSDVDQREAKKLGKESVKFSKKYDSSFSMCIEERGKNLNTYQVKIGKNKLIDIGGKTKYMPDYFINKKKNYISNTFIKYALPLIGRKIPDFGSLI